MVASMPCGWFGDQRDTDIAPGLLQIFCLGGWCSGPHLKFRLVCSTLVVANFNTYLSREEGLSSLPQFHVQW